LFIQGREEEFEERDPLLHPIEEQMKKNPRTKTTVDARLRARILNSRSEKDQLQLNFKGSFLMDTYHPSNMKIQRETFTTSIAA
jgi:hypothetical protein